MFAVNFYASSFVSRENSIGKKLIRLGWEKTVYRLLFTLANTLKCYDDMGLEFNNSEVDRVHYIAKPTIAKNT